ncbi:MAG: hypothetical protein RMY34_36130 [Aulosira sp. DedQUE10]|nr:hypothetical protein [Aulosira sp. DedQUE10]
MIIHILQELATPTQINEMLQANRFYIKTAVDIRQNRAMEILDPAIREQVKQIIHKLLGGV